jgi:hypothetical protein
MCAFENLNFNTLSSFTPPKSRFRLFEIFLLLSNPENKEGLKKRFKQAGDHP